MRVRLAPLLAAIALTACVSRPVTQRGGVPLSPPAVGTSEEVRALVRRALTLDAAADRAADSLYGPDAVVIANARARLAAPRFAGISYGGRVTLAAETVTIAGRFAWVMVDYRWIDAQQRLAEAGRATFVCEQREGGAGWKIVHAHSSQLLPWDR
ncbi:MAG: nuclear transport factor 2 family protein [Gemmatimonadales bacterium]